MGKVLDGLQVDDLVWKRGAGGGCSAGWDSGKEPSDMEKLPKCNLFKKQALHSGMRKPVNDGFAFIRDDEDGVRLRREKVKEKKEENRTERITQIFGGQNF